MTTHLHVSNPRDLSLLARQGSDEEIRGAALKRILTHSDLKKLCSDEDFWLPGWSTGNSLFLLYPCETTSTLLDIKPKSKWWIDPALQHCNDGDTLWKVWKYFKRLKSSRPTINPSILSNKAMSPDLRYEIAYDMLSQPDGHVLSLIKEIEAHVPDLENWEEFLSLENLSFMGHVSLCYGKFYDQRDYRWKPVESPKIAAIRKKSLSALDKKVRRENMVTNYSEIYHFLTVDFSEESLPAAKRIAERLAEIALSEEQLETTPDEHFGWGPMLNNEGSLGRTRCLFYISLSDLISASKRKQAAKYAYPDLKDHGHLQGDKMPFAQAFPHLVTDLFPEEALNGWDFNTRTLQELCRAHGQQHRYIREALARKSKSRETKQILASFS